MEQETGDKQETGSSPDSEPEQVTEIKNFEKFIDNLKADPNNITKEQITYLFGEEAGMFGRIINVNKYSDIAVLIYSTLADPAAPMIATYSMEGKQLDRQFFSFFEPEGCNDTDYKVVKPNIISLREGCVFEDITDGTVTEATKEGYFIIEEDGKIKVIEGDLPDEYADEATSRLDLIEKFENQLPYSLSGDEVKEYFNSYGAQLS